MSAVPKNNLSKENVPVVITELLQLTHLDVPLEDVTWQKVTMTSDKSICMRYRIRKQGKYHHKSMLTVLSPSDSTYPSFTTEVPVSSAKTNPYKPIIAIQAGLVFRIYNLKTQELIQKYATDWNIVYWAWFDHETIVMVSPAAIYHWSIYDGSSPVKMFCRHQRLEPSSQIINYTSDDNGIWMAVVGLNLYKDKVIGIAQLYSLSRNFSQPFEAHAVCFANYCFQGNKYPSTVFIAATRSELTGAGKLYIIELGPHQNGNSSLVNTCDSFDFKDTWGKYDFPVSMQVCSLGLVYIVTKYGYVYLCDIETGFCIASIMIATDIVFTSVLNTDTQGIIAISRNGQVLAVDIEESQISEYIRCVLKRPAVADRLQFNISNSTKL